MSDTRVDRGMRAMLELRERRLAQGERPLGWKVGFGAPAALERLGTQAPLVGFLTDATLVEPGAAVSVESWEAPVLEPELAIHVGDDLGVGAVGAAIELADLDASLADPEAILAGNIFHRGVVLGPERAPSAAGLTVRVTRNGEQAAATDEPEALTGRLDELVRFVGELLPRHGAELRPGDVVIAGSTVPALQVAPGDRFEYELRPLCSLRIAAAPVR